MSPEQKLAGVLVPVFALRGRTDFGIGDVAALRECLVWAASHGLGAVQILPVNEPGMDHSPYNLLSAMALDPLTLSMEPEDLPGLTHVAFLQAQADAPKDADRVDYARVQGIKEALLAKAHAGFLGLPPTGALRREFRSFRKAEAPWLEFYLLHRALIERHGDGNPADWPTAHRSPDATKKWLAALPPRERQAFEARMEYFAYIQWVAWRQWEDARRLADQLGLALIGDIPVGVSLCSADVWAHPAWFDVSRSSGAPPERVFQSDPFTEQWGQNWGFPLYNWTAMAADGHIWWRMRLRRLFRIFHLLRVDHALGFFRIYSFPWRPEENARFIGLSKQEAAALTGGRLPGFVDFDDETEERREHNRKRGMEILSLFLEESAPHHLIAEDLGEVAPYVRPTLAALEIPGFKIPQWEHSGDRLTPGISYPRLSLATFATHDHPPLREIWEGLHREIQAGGEASGRALHQQWQFMDFCARPDFFLPAPFSKTIHEILLRGLFLSNSWLAIHMISDLLGNADRFNTPGSIGGANWTQRLPCPISELDSRYGDTLAFLEQALWKTGRWNPT